MRDIGNSLDNKAKILIGKTQLKFKKGTRKEISVMRSLCECLL